MSRTKITLPEFSTPEHLSQFESPDSCHAVPVYSLPLGLGQDSCYHEVVVEFWHSRWKFSRLAIWWVQPRQELMSEIILPVRTREVLTYGSTAFVGRTVKPLRMPEHKATATSKGRPAYEVWPIWPYVNNFSTCTEHGGVMFVLYPPKVGTEDSYYLSVSASLESCMTLGFSTVK